MADEYEPYFAPKDKVLKRVLGGLGGQWSDYSYTGAGTGGASGATYTTANMVTV